MLLGVQNFAIGKNFSSQNAQKNNHSKTVMTYPVASVSFTGNSTELLKGLREVSLGLLEKAAKFHDRSNIPLSAISDKIVSFKQKAYHNEYIKILAKSGKIIHIFRDQPLTNLRQSGPVARFLVIVSPRNADIFAQKLPDNVLTYFIDENGAVTRNKNEISLSMLMPISKYRDEFIPVTDNRELSGLIKYMQEFNKEVSEGLASRGY